jgi:hypothetical protein
VFIKGKQKRMHAHMRRHASVPKNLHSAVCRHNDQHSENSLVGTIMARDTPQSNPMLLHLDAGKDCLRIFLKQLTNGQVYSFLVAQIKYADIVIGWIWEDSNLFLLAQVIQDKTYDEIYCYPTDVSRNKWLKFFESKQVRTVPFFLKQNSRHIPQFPISRYVMHRVIERESGSSNITNHKTRRCSMD